jgi:hypothetical protein
LILKEVHLASGVCPSFCVRNRPGNWKNERRRRAHTQKRELSISLGSGSFLLSV